MKIFQKIFVLFAIFVFAGTLVFGGQSAVPANFLNKIKPKFITALAHGNDGEIWIATEGNGLLLVKRDPANNKNWRQMAVPAARENSFPQTVNFYALCRDRFGRIWAGTDCCGIAFFDGNAWTTLNRENAFPGTRIFAIACSPTNGDLAVAHDCGISILFEKTQTWQHFSTLDGLPANEVSTLKFSPAGTLFAGFACDGIARAKADENYKNWQKMLGEKLTNDICVPAEFEENPIVATSDGIVFAGTKNAVLPGKFVSCFFQGLEGLWAGTRQNGCVFLDLKNGFAEKFHACGNAWVRDFLPIGGNTILVATYGNGLQTIAGGGNAIFNFKNEAQNAPKMTFPQISQMFIEQTRERFSRAEKLPNDAPWAIFLGDDWATHGDWCGRFGRRIAKLCAVNSPGGEPTYALSENYKIRGEVGESVPEDALRRWVHWENKMENGNVLFEPGTCIRQEAEWDDHGEAHAYEVDGPDVWAFVEIPAGTHEIALYFYNPNPHEGRPAYRDYLIEVRHQNSTEKTGKILARTRVFEFGGSGVYKIFAVNGAGTFAFRVRRNHSFNTILNGIFVQKIHESESEIFGFAHLAYTRGTEPRPRALSGQVAEEDFPLNALNLWRLATANVESVPALRSRRFLRNLAYIDAQQNAAHEAILENWRWHIGHWQPADRQKFLKQKRWIWRNRQASQLPANSAEWYPFSPDTLPLSKDEIVLMYAYGLDEELRALRGVPADSPKAIAAKNHLYEVQAEIKANCGKGKYRVVRRTFGEPKLCEFLADLENSRDD